MSETVARLTVKLPGNIFMENGVFSKVVEKYTGNPTDENYYDVEVTHGGKNFADVFRFFQIAGELAQTFTDTEISLCVSGRFGSSGIWILPDEGSTQCFLDIDTNKVNDFKKDKLRDIKKIIDELC